MGALAIGLGAGDVVLPLVTGQTWLSVPEVLLIEFVGQPKFGVGGKDIILQCVSTSVVARWGNCHTANQR